MNAAVRLNEELFNYVTVHLFLRFSEGWSHHTFSMASVIPLKVDVEYFL